MKIFHLPDLAKVQRFVNGLRKVIYKVDQPLFPWKPAVVSTITYAVKPKSIWKKR